MFTLFQACNNESVCNLVERPPEVPAPGPPLYQSQFACKVREDAYCARTGCFRTMGVPKVCQCPPENYLKKQSRAPISIRCPAVPAVQMVCNPCQTECPRSDVAENGSGNGSEECSQGQQQQQQQVPECVCPQPRCRIARFCTCVGIPEKPPVPSPCSTFGVIPTCCKDYIKDNIRKAIRQVPRKPAMRFVDDRVGTTKNWCTSGLPRLFVFGENFGKIPCYLDDIKHELYLQDQKAKSIMQAKDHNMAQTCRHLEPIEREAIVCGLKKNWEQVFADYQAMPLLIDTPGKILKKSELEKTLKNLEKDIQLIERHDHVFVADTCKSFYLS